MLWLVGMGYCYMGNWIYWNWNWKTKIFGFGFSWGFFVLVGKVYISVDGVITPAYMKRMGVGRIARQSHT